MNELIRSGWKDSFVLQGKKKFVYEDEHRCHDWQQQQEQTMNKMKKLSIRASIKRIEKFSVENFPVNFATSSFINNERRARRCSFLPWKREKQHKLVSVVEDLRRNKKNWKITTDSTRKDEQWAMEKKNFIFSHHPLYLTAIVFENDMKRKICFSSSPS